MLEEWCISVRGQRAAEDRRALRIDSRYIARITELVVNGVGRSPPGCPAQNGPPGPVIEDELRYPGCKKLGDALRLSHDSQVEVDEHIAHLVA